MLLTCVLETLSGQASPPLLTNLPLGLLRAEDIIHLVHLQFVARGSSARDFVLQQPLLVRFVLESQLQFHNFALLVPDPLILNNLCI